ncbi:MAG: ATP-binding cassette domain-containing protein [Corynebacterium sp.]|nr:ATP-binding cassette domain-containing protein [Corynebacterium sp.]
MNTVPLLQLDGVSVGVGDTPICHDVSLTIQQGETHVLLGPNGSGKSSLLHAIMGVGPFNILAGSVKFQGKEISELSTSERATLGIGMAFQRPPKLPGVTVTQLAKAMHADSRVAAAAEDLRLSHLENREVNCGFSGGETKRWEIMKLLLQKPQLCLFDEPESGVDLEHVAVVGKTVSKFLQEPGEQGNRGALIVTHTGFILDHVDADIAHLMVDGRIVEHNDPLTLFERIRQYGYSPEGK